MSQRVPQVDVHGRKYDSLNQIFHGLGTAGSLKNYTACPKIPNLKTNLDSASVPLEITFARYSFGMGFYHLQVYSVLKVPRAQPSLL